MISSTPLRKSMNRKQNEDFLLTPLEAEVNDDNERRKRRSVYHVERSLSSIPDSNSASSDAIEQIMQHIKACQKLCNENKINIRNSWELKVIDYIYQYVFKNTILDSDVILEGARTLEVCVKVYGYKVDYLSQEVLKLVSTREAQGDKENSVIGEDHIEEGSSKKKKQKKGKRGAKASIANNKSDILLSEVPKMVPIDFVGNVDIYASTHQNMFTNKILMDHAGYKFNLLNDTDYGFISYNSKDPTLLGQLFLNKFPKIPSIRICTEFKNFHVDEEDKAFNKSIADIMSDTSKLQTVGLITNDIVYDDDGVPVPDLDGSIRDVFADNVDTTEYDDAEVGDQAAQRRIEMITSFCPTDIPVRNDNSTSVSVSNVSNAFLETVWVGPSHWKNKLIRPSAPIYSGKPDVQAVQVRKKRKTSSRQTIMPIDLNSIPNIDFETTCRANVSLDIRKYTLPSNNLFAVPELDTLMLRRLIPKYEYQLDKNDGEYEHTPYDYDNANDSQYCSQIGLPGVNDDAPDAENSAHEEMQNGIPHEHTENGNILPECLNTTQALVDAPDLVTQVYVPYALRAKNVNMKKLKSATLKCLTRNDQKDTAEALHIQPSTFTKLLKEIPTKLPEKARSNVSVPLAFFTLLHLGNEHNLELTGSESFDEISIDVIQE